MTEKLMQKNTGTNLDIIMMNIEDIEEYDQNPRKNNNAVEIVAKSISEYGFKVPIIIDSNNVIVAGHTRYKAASTLGLDKIPCIIASDLSDEQIKAFRIMENRTSDFAAWDMDLLKVELQELIDQGISLDQTGFDEEMLKEVEALELDDDVDDKPKKTCFCPKCGFEFEVSK